MLMLVRSPRILAANRDEVLHRPTMPAHWHAFEPISSPSHSPDSLASSRPYVLAGRDAVAGGTWLGINRSGHVAVMHVQFTSIRPESSLLITLLNSQN